VGCTTLILRALAGAPCNRYDLTSNFAAQNTAIIATVKVVFTLKYLELMDFDSQVYTTVKYNTMQ
jgi:hypothetical protein